MIAENRYFKIVYRQRNGYCDTSTTDATTYEPELVVVKTPTFTASNNAPYPEPYEPPPFIPPRYYIHDWEPHLKKYRRRWQERAAVPRCFPVTRWTNPGVRDAQRNIRKDQLRRLRSGTSKRR